MTAQIVAAYADSNKLVPEDLAALIRAVYRRLSTQGQPESRPQAEL